MIGGEGGGHCRNSGKVLHEKAGWIRVRDGGGGEAGLLGCKAILIMSVEY